jgi:hypothetical protein
MTTTPAPRILHLEPDLQCRVSSVDGGAEIRLFRRPISDPSATGFLPTEAAVRIPGHRLSEVIAALSALGAS